METVRRGKRAWVDGVMAVAALGGVAASALYEAPLRSLYFLGCDAKTLYGAVWNFWHGRDAFSLANLGQIFDANGVVRPPSWFGYAPVYPVPTLVLLGPMAMAGMVPAVVGMMVVSAAVMAWAVYALLRYSEREYGLGLGGRVVVLVACAAGPLLAAGLGAGNPAVMCAGLCVLAFVLRKRGRYWGCASMLGVALVLKPHVAVWVLVAMALLPEREGRGVAWRATAMALGFATAVMGWLAAAGQLGMQMRGYAEILRAETAAGSSMNASGSASGGVAVLQVVGQVTALRSVLGFWGAGLGVGVMAGMLLVVGGVLLVRMSRRVRTEEQAMLSVAGWCVLGMLATYHRAYDGMVLMLVWPWVVARLRWWQAWVVAGCYVGMELGVSAGVLNGWSARYGAGSMVTFLWSRQAGLAAVGLMVGLLVAMARERRRGAV